MGKNEDILNWIIMFQKKILKILDLNLGLGCILGKKIKNHMNYKIGQVAKMNHLTMFLNYGTMIIEDCYPFSKELRREIEFLTKKH